MRKMLLLKLAINYIVLQGRVAQKLHKIFQSSEIAIPHSQTAQEVRDSRRRSRLETATSEGVSPSFLLKVHYQNKALYKKIKPSGPHARAQPEASRSAATATTRMLRRCAIQGGEAALKQRRARCISVFFAESSLSEQKKRRYAKAHLRVS